MIITSTSNLFTSQSVQNIIPSLGSREMDRGLSMRDVTSVRRYDPFSLATSIWLRLLSTQYRFSPIQSTARPSAVARPVCTTTSIFDKAEENGYKLTSTRILFVLAYFLHFENTIHNKIKIIHLLAATTMYPDKAQRRKIYTEKERKQSTYLQLA